LQELSICTIRRRPVSRKTARVSLPILLMAEVHSLPGRLLFR
jgi:hypothetical protein